MLAMIPISPPIECWLVFDCEVMEGPYQAIGHAVDCDGRFMSYDVKTYWLVTYPSIGAPSSRWFKDDEVYFTKEAAEHDITTSPPDNAR